MTTFSNEHWVRDKFSRTHHRNIHIQIKSSCIIKEDPRRKTRKKRRELEFENKVSLTSLKSSAHTFPGQLISLVSAASICSGWHHSTKCGTRRDVPQQLHRKGKMEKLDKSLQILHLNILHSKLSEFYKGQRFFVDAQLDDPEYSVIEGGIKSQINWANNATWSVRFTES
jgi:hypothetical protein